jgi:glucose-1-phosphate cytidylyltransferase
LKAVILAGGYGTRISEESGIRPKPMIEIGGRPILWHIMKIYAAHGISDFVICCGYKGAMIKEYFRNYAAHNTDFTIDLRAGQVMTHQNQVEDWRVTLIDTGENTLTGGRIKRIQPFVADETFCLTYGDGVGDVDISESIDFHRTSGALATLTAVQPPGRFGAFTLDQGDQKVRGFKEKPSGDGETAWVNGGFFVLEPGIFDYIEGDSTIWEREPLEQLARHGHLAAYRHSGFWQPMDTLRDKHVLDELWQQQRAAWKVW